MRILNSWKGGMVVIAMALLTVVWPLVMVITGIVVSLMMLARLIL